MYVRIAHSMNIYFITGNAHKFEEICTFIPNLEQLDIDLPEIQEIDPHKVIAAKLQEAFKHHAGPFIVEDTSLYLDCIPGLPGPLIKWFLKTIGTEGLAALTVKLNDTKAEAKTMIGYAQDKNTLQFFEGTVKGTIVSPRGTNGFGWDALFVPEGQTKTFAEMTQEEKNAQDMNMRKAATLKLKAYIG
jgi:non-canonical purine NTP pyrophosphatase (RdgB/HAM1 family)